MLVPKTTPFRRVTSNIQHMSMQEYNFFLQHVELPGVVWWQNCKKRVVANELSFLAPPEKQWTTPTIQSPRP